MLFSCTIQMDGAPILSTLILLDIDFETAKLEKIFLGFW